MNQVKDAFQRVRQDIESLRYEVGNLKLELSEVSWRVSQVLSEIQNLREKSAFPLVCKENEIQKNPTHSPLEPTSINPFPTHNPTLGSLKTKNLTISIGNEGGPTDRQTDRQTDNTTKILKISSDNPIQDAAKILDSLDSLKKEIRLKFKRLTNKELLVFSTIYQLGEERGFTDYKTLAHKLNLTESSIRDYVGRLINKGISVEKLKINNKNIHLSISKDLKKITSLSTILHLRNL